MLFASRVDPPSRIRLLWTAAGVRHAAWAAMLSVLLAAGTVGIAYWQTTEHLTRQHLSVVSDEARMLAEIAEQTSIERLADILGRGRDVAGRRFGIVDAEGRLMAGDLDPAAVAFADPKQGMPAAAVQRLDVVADKPSGARSTYGVVRFPIAGGGALVLARPMDEITTLSARLRAILAAVLVVILAVAFFAGWSTARASAIRVGRLGDTAREIMSGNLSRRLQISARDDEIDELARTVNRMLERIEVLMASIREVSDNVAHDLRTPLNRLRVRSESVLRDARSEEDLREGLAQAIDDADALVRTFNAMLLVARLDAGTLAAASEDRLELGPLVEGIVDLYKPVAEEDGAELEADIIDAVVTIGNRQLIGQAITNLVENALKYGRPERSHHPFVIRVAVRRTEVGAAIIVGDSGSGIAPEDRERALGRFVRLDASRSTPGSGLGLSLVAAVARAHGGRLSLESNEPGLRAVLTLPEVTAGQAPAAVRALAATS